MAKYCFYLLCISVLIAYIAAECTESATTVIGHAAPTGKICSGDLIFEDEFDKFNLKIWQHEVTLAGGGNNEFEYYLNNRSNSFTQDGALHIRPSYLTDQHPEEFLYFGTLNLNGGSPSDECTNPAADGCIKTGTETCILNPIRSARIRTVYSFSFKFGRISVRAKLPAGDWLWPAIWLLPTYSEYGTLPASGEIDLVEARGNKNLVNSDGLNVGTQQVSSTLHWGPYSDLNQYTKTHWETNYDAGFDTDFHVYDTIWSPDGFAFQIDGVEVGNVKIPDGGFWELGQFEGVENPWQAGTKMAPFDQEFCILINLAVGGGMYFNDDWTNEGGKPWENGAPTAMTDFWQGKDQWERTWDFSNGNSDLVVDYVKVYAI